jgi:hypothetical protein
MAIKIKHTIAKHQYIYFFLFKPISVLSFFGDFEHIFLEIKIELGAV